MRNFGLGCVAVAFLACGKSGGGSGDGLSTVGDSPVRIKLPQGTTMVHRGPDQWGDLWVAEGTSVEVRLGTREPVTDSTLESRVKEARIVGDLDPIVKKDPATGLITFTFTGNPTSNLRKDRFFIHTWLPDDKGTMTSCYGVGKSPADPAIEACRSLSSTVKPAAKPDLGPGPSAAGALE